MKLFLGCLCLGVKGAAYTYKLSPSEHQICFQEEVKKAGTTLVSSFFVHTDSKVNFFVYGPSNEKKYELRRKSKGDVEIPVSAPGFYSLCFTRAGGKALDVIDFDVYVKGGHGKYEDSEKKNPVLEGNILKLRKELQNIRTRMKGITQRDARNLQTIRSASSSVGVFSLFEVIAIGAVSISQIVILKRLFTRGGKLRI
ncbi:MAG: emp24/gp25L/p24 family protein [Amphiamblys sp. WSBS2006]|nr:MAG: emp24/gp25L/p24 family protein [Amphiamblys sp. WSBS2006]